jgi:transcriptional regulator with XRE-family HTH domain
MAKQRKKVPGNPWPKRLKALRERLGLTQTEAGARVGVSQRSWALWEAGRIPSPPVQILLDLLDSGKL